MYIYIFTQIHSATFTKGMRSCSEQTTAGASFNQAAVRHIMPLRRGPAGSNVKQEVRRACSNAWLWRWNITAFKPHLLHEIS